MINFLFRPQTTADNPAINVLHAEVFGPGRFARTAYRIREASIQGPLLSLTAWDGDQLAGVIQLTAITIGGQRGAVLLGPIAIAPAYQKRGCGMRLVTDGMKAVAERGYALVILVGDLPYYRKVGFQAVPVGQITLPGPADPARLLACSLQPGTLATYHGLVAADNEPPFADAERLATRLHRCAM